MKWYWLAILLSLFSVANTATSASAAMKLPPHAEAVPSNGSPALYIRLSNCVFKGNYKPLYSTDQHKSVKALLYAFGKNFPFLTLSNLKLVDMTPPDDPSHWWPVTYHYTADLIRSRTTSGTSSKGRNATIANTTMINFSYRGGSNTNRARAYRAELNSYREAMPRKCEISAVSYQKKIK